MLREHRRDDVRLVARRARDQQVGLLDARLLRASRRLAPLPSTRRRRRSGTRARSAGSGRCRSTSSSCSSCSASTIVEPTWPAPMTKIFTAAGRYCVRLAWQAVRALVRAAVRSRCSCCRVAPRSGVRPGRGRRRRRRERRARLVRVARGLDAPVHVTAPREGRIPGCTSSSSAGTIRVVERGRLRAAPFLDIREQLVRRAASKACSGSRSIPTTRRTGRFYVELHGRQRRHARRRVPLDGGRARSPRARASCSSSTSRTRTTTAASSRSAPTGACTSAWATAARAATPRTARRTWRTLLGKLLSIDVDRAGPTPEIVALGLRNPWRFSFDRETGDLWIGDVGQGSLGGDRLTRRAAQPGLENYGWDVFEGRSRFEDKPQGPRDARHAGRRSTATTAACSVTGGFVYRGRRCRPRRPLPLRRLLLGLFWSLRSPGGRAAGCGASRSAWQPDRVRRGRQRRGLRRLARRHGLPAGA